MNKPEIKNLINKYLNSTATQEEKDRLFEYYARMQTYQDWDVELMGNKEEARARILDKISHQIDTAENRSSFSLWKIAVTITLMISTGILGWCYFKNSKQIHFQTLSANNRIIKIGLEDGTKVWLNSGSKLSYPERFGNVREVSLEGEAYFDVVHQNRPFVIRSGKMITQVLGTSFNIQAYAVDNINKVSVVSGKVGVTVPGRQKKQIVFLTRNQEVAFNKKSNVVNKANLTDATTAISWMDNKIKFRNTPFPEAMRELERIYNVHISYTSELERCPVFADFKRNDNASKVLGMLAKSLGGNVVQRDSNAYHLTGRPCK